MWEMRGVTALCGRTSPMDCGTAVRDDIGITDEYTRQLRSNANKERREYRWNINLGEQASAAVGCFTSGDRVRFVKL